MARQRSNLPLRIGSSLGRSGGLRPVEFTIGDQLGRVAEAVLADGINERNQARLLDVQREGAAEGLRAADEGRPIAAGPGTSQAADLAFLKSAGAAYFERRRIGVENAIAEAAAAHPEDIGAFDAKIAGLRGSVMASAPAELRPDIDNLFAGLASDARRKVTHAVRVKTEAGQNAVHLEALARAEGDLLRHARARDDRAVADARQRAGVALEARTDLSPQQKAAAALKLDEGVKFQALLGGFDAMLPLGLERAEKYIAAVRDNAELDPVQRHQAADWMQAHTADLRRQQAEAKREADAKADEARARFLSNFTLKVAVGQATAAEIEEHYQKGDLKPAERSAFHLKLLGQAEADERINAQAAATQAKHEREAWRSDFDLSLAAGEAGPEDVEAAYRRGLLTPDERTERMKGAVKADGAAKRANYAYLHAAPMDPKNPDDRKAVDLHFGKASALWADLPADQRAARQVDYAGRVGMVPDALQSRWRVAMRGSDPAALNQAANEMLALQAANPALLRDVDEATRDLAAPLMARLALGQPPAEAVASALKAREVSPAEIKARQDRLRDDKEQSPERRRAWLAGKLGGWWKPEARDDALYADWNAAFEQEYAAHGDAAVARNIALSRVQKVWGRSNADGGGDRWMRYPPENYYGNEFGADWIGEQLRHDIAARGTEAAEAAGLGVADPVNPDAKTKLRLEAMPGAGPAAPEYRVLKQQGESWSVALDESGRPLRWRPDWVSSPARQRMAQEARAEITAAHRPKAPAPAPSVQPVFKPQPKPDRDFRRRFQDAMAAGNRTQEAIWDFLRLDMGPLSPEEAADAERQFQAWQKDNLNFSGVGR